LIGQKVADNDCRKQQHHCLRTARSRREHTDRDHEDLFGKPVADDTNDRGEGDGKEKSARLKPSKQIGEVIDHAGDYTRTNSVDRIDPFHSHNQRASAVSIRSTLLVWMRKRILHFVL
jgi:hypothetical protein